jgi:hypothetical protein
MTLIETTQALEEAVRRATTVDGVLDYLDRWAHAPVKALAVIARHSPVWDRSLLYMVLSVERWPDEVWGGFLANPHRTPEVSELAAIWECRRLLSEGEPQGRGGPRGRLMDLARAGVLDPDGEAVRQMQHYLRSPGDQANHARRARVLSTLLAVPGLTRAQLVEIYEENRDFIATQREDIELPARFVTHSALPITRRRAILREHEADVGSPPALALLLASDEIRNDPVLRPRLRRWAREVPTLGYIDGLIRDANPDDCAALFRHAVKVYPLGAAELLSRSAPLIGPLLSESDIMPLLKDPDSEVRLLAISASAHIGGSGRAQSPVGMEAGARVPEPAPRSGRKASRARGSV